MAKTKSIIGSLFLLNALFASAQASEIRFCPSDSLNGEPQINLNIRAMRI